MFNGKPIIGVTGGIGSGKSFIAALFGELHCAVIDSDAQARAVYRDPAVRQTLRQWWGDAVFAANGSPDRAAIAKRVFSDPAERRRLEELVHPLVSRARRQEMEKSAGDPLAVAFVWDAPLLLEAGLKDQCDAIVFVDAPLELRLDRVFKARGWDEAELLKRQNLQWPLDRKRKISDYVVENTAGRADARSQVQAVLSRILDRASHGPDSR